MPESTLGVGIIGVSPVWGWAATAHIPALRALPNYEIRALSAHSAETARAAGEKFGVNAVFSDHELLVTQPDVDVVAVTVKVPHHRELVSDALAAGKAVYCEWPLGRDLEDARAMAAIAGAQGLRTIVGLQARQAPAIEFVKQLLGDGYVGEVLSTTMIGVSLPGDVVIQPNVYMLDVENGANLLTVAVGHSLDTLTYLLGEFAELSAISDLRRPLITADQTREQVVKTAPDQIAVIGTLTSGATASVHVREAVAGGTGFLWEINGSDGTLRITADAAYPEIFPLTVAGARGRGELAELRVPAAITHRWPELTGLEGPPLTTLGERTPRSHQISTTGRTQCRTSPTQSNATSSSQPSRSPPQLGSACTHIPSSASTRSPGSRADKEQLIMAIQVETVQREVVLVEAAHIRPMMGLEILEPLPSRNIPYPLVDPFILVHEGVVPITPERAKLDTTHPHRGFDNLWYVIAGEASTGHSTGPEGKFERARLRAGSLLKLRTGRGVWHAEGIGEDELREGKSGTEMRGVLFWVNLARKDKNAEPTSQLIQPGDVPVRHEGDAVVRVLVGEGSVVELGTPGLILDIELPNGGSFGNPVPSDFNGFVYMLEGEASFGANRQRASRSQTAVLGPGDALSVVDATPGTRFMLMSGKPYGEEPVYNGPYVD